MIVMTVTGNLTRDCEAKTTPYGKEVSVFSVASNVGYGEKATSQFVECEYHVASEKFRAMLTKGSRVTVVGSAVLKPGKDGSSVKVYLKVFEVHVQSQKPQDSSPTFSDVTPPPVRRGKPAPAPADPFGDDDYPEGTGV